MRNSPEIRYAQSGEVSIAYQIVGDGPLDIIMAPGSFTHLEIMWEEPNWAYFVDRLAAFSRLMIFDKRGSGMSDRVVEVATLEDRTDDMRAVMDAVGSERAAVIGASEGGAMSALFAATYPKRTTALVLYGTYAFFDPRMADTEFASYAEYIRRTWGSEAYIRDILPQMAPSVGNDEQFIHWLARLARFSLTPGSRIALTRMNQEIDIRPILPSIRVPTLVIFRGNDRLISTSHSHLLAEEIPGAKLVELPGLDHLPWVGDVDRLVDELEIFLTGNRHGGISDRVLATVLFTDIVESTRQATAMGDRRWREVLVTHDAIMEQSISRYRGQVVKRTGDGYLATFDGPGRAIQAAQTAASDLRRLGLEIRAGLHAGEIELMAGDVGGIAVHTAARVLAEALPGEVWVSRTVRDLVAGSGIDFDERGAFQLKGIPGEWRLFSVRPPA